MALLAYSVGIPLAAAALPVEGGARGNKLDDETFKQKYGFLYAAYKPSFVAWELTGLITKCFLAAVPVFATESTLRGGSNEEGNKGSFDVGAGGSLTRWRASPVGKPRAFRSWSRSCGSAPHRAGHTLRAAERRGRGRARLGARARERAERRRRRRSPACAFDDDEKFRVCAAAVAATLAAELAMVAAARPRRALNAPARTAKAAVKTARGSFKRLVSRARLGGEGGKTRELAFGLDAAETGASSTNEKTKTKTKKAEALLDSRAARRAARAVCVCVDGDLHSSTVEVRIAPGGDRA